MKFSGLLGMVAALVETTQQHEDGEVELRARDGLPVPDEADRVDVPPPTEVR
ncbi:hypothetical protein BH24ACT6_BH24ACT6_05710 [soil metagenome]